MPFPKYQLCLEQTSNPITFPRGTFLGMLSSRYKYIKSINGLKSHKVLRVLVVTEEFFQILNQNRNKYLRFTKENMKINNNKAEPKLVEEYLCVVFNPICKTHNEDDAGD